MQFHHRDIVDMGESALRAELAALEYQIAIAGEHGGCHWWLIERMSCLRAALAGTEGTRL